jgi:hypothetical protein
MRTIVNVAILFVAAIITAQAQTRETIETLTAAGTTSAVRAETNHHTLQVIVSGSPSACTVRLEGSLDNSNFFDLSGTQTCTSNLMFHVDGKPVTYVRANLLTWTGGTNAVVRYRGTN